MLQVYVHDFLVFKEQAFVFSFLLALLFLLNFFSTVCFSSFSFYGF